MRVKHQWYPGNPGGALELVVPEAEEAQQAPAKRMRRNEFQVHGNTREGRD